MRLIHGRQHRVFPGCHLHDNAVAVEVGGGLGDLGLGGGGRHVDCLGGVLFEEL